MSETDDALEEMQGWLTGLSAADEAVEDSVEQEVAALLALVGLQAGERLRIAATQPLDGAYVALVTAAVKALGATFSATTGEADALVSFDSALGLEGEGEDAALLREAAAALQPAGRYVIELPNREWVVRNDVQNRVFTGTDGRMYLERSEFDFVGGRHRVTVTELGTGGSRREVRSTSRRLYTLTELIALLEAAGFRFEAVYGGFEGEPYGPDAERTVVLARKGDA